jgi:hypothetical protein
MFTCIEEVEERVIVDDFKTQREVIQDMIDAFNSMYCEHLSRDEQTLLKICVEFGETILMIYDQMPKPGTYVRIKE